MRIALAVVLAIAIGVAVWAGTRDGDTTTPSPTEPVPTETTDGGTESAVVRAYFARDDAVAPVARSVAAPALLRGAIEALVAGPTADEEALGFSSAVPEGVRVLGVSIAEGTATIDLSSEFASGGGSRGMFMRLAQLVHTATQFSPVKRVTLWIDGEQVRTFSSEGIVLEETLTRAGYEDEAPAILVESPLPKAQVERTFTVRGTANTFEATLNWELAVGDGEPITGFTTATCGTGCRGTFSFSVDSPDSGEATLRVFELSAEDGSRIKLVEIPLLVG